MLIFFKLFLHLELPYFKRNCFNQCSTQVLTHQHHEAVKIVQVSNVMSKVIISSNVSACSVKSINNFNFKHDYFICNVCCKQLSRLSNI